MHFVAQTPSNSMATSKKVDSPNYWPQAIVTMQLVYRELGSPST